jgi:invasion protein IalB
MPTWDLKHRKENCSWFNPWNYVYSISFVSFFFYFAASESEAAESLQEKEPSAEGAETWEKIFEFCKSQLFDSSCNVQHVNLTDTERHMGLTEFVLNFSKWSISVQAN